MTGFTVFRQALQLLGYTNAYGETDATRDGELYKRGLALVNQIDADLHACAGDGDPAPLASLRQELTLPDRVCRDVMPYGVAMLLAQSESDGDNQALYAALYNRKRRSLTRTERIGDVLPRVGE